MRQATELLDWARAEPGPRRLQPALLQVVRGRAPQRQRTVPRPPRRGRPRRSGRLPLARRGGRGTRHHLCRSAPRRPALRQRAQGPRRREGRRGRDLPADDPRGRRRDAGLRPDRRHPQRRLRRLLGRVGARADGVLRGEGAGHRRRRPPQGQDGADQAGRSTSTWASSSRSRRSSSSATPASSARCARAATSSTTRRWRRPSPECPAGADGGRAPALHPLHLGLDREAEGDPAHHRRLPDRGHRHPPLRLRPEARRATSTGARPTSAGSPATPTSSTGRSPTAPPA